MRVLVACEESQEVCKAFRDKGHEAYSCDILESSGGHPKWHIQGDVLEHLGDGWDLMVAHPPCTYLSVSGARWLYNADGSVNAERQKNRDEALDFVQRLMDAPIEKICVENPVSVISSHIRKPDQTIQPYQFGENASKRTCLWLKNLPCLRPTDVIEPEKVTTRNGREYDKWWYETSLIQNLEERAKARSKTFRGIAEAMANQWG